MLLLFLHQQISLIILYIHLFPQIRCHIVSVLLLLLLFADDVFRFTDGW